LYCGRAITETLLASDSLEAKTVFVSAGLGVVSRFEEVPPYGLTVTNGHDDSIGSRIKGHFEAALWWNALAQAKGTKRPLASLIEREGARLMLIAMPGTYLEMIIDELADLSRKTLKAIRLIGPRRREELPEFLQPSWLPYDSRLDSPKSGVNGTASDFPHRALRHFALHVLPANGKGSREAHAADVEASLSHFKVYVRPRGRSLPDEELLAVIRKLWPRLGGRRTLMLRELRDAAGIACEQKRFQRLATRIERSLHAKG
jgi:hypothetical protein